jgi:squalene-hopene/tetraprenyl-beta-curcumene cyclase
MNDVMQAAVAGAAEFIAAQGQDGFAETRHTIILQQGKGLGSAPDIQVGDVFARAVLGGLLAESAGLARDTADADALGRLARREAEHVAASRPRGGSWRYFPDLPDVPPDLDTLAAALELFCRAAPGLARECEGPIAEALRSQEADGSVDGWIAANEPVPDAGRRDDGARRCSGSRRVDLCGRFFRALRLYDAARYRPAINAGVRYVVSQQRDDGAWHGVGSCGPYNATALCFDLLLERSTDGAPAVERALEFVLASQREDGGWGAQRSTALETALALWILREGQSAAVFNAVLSGLGWLRRHQARAGSWSASPWIDVSLGESRESTLHPSPDRSRQMLTYRSVTLTTAFCLRSLLWYTRDAALQPGLRS